MSRSRRFNDLFSIFNICQCFFQFFDKSPYIFCERCCPVFKIILLWTSSFCHLDLFRASDFELRIYRRHLNSSTADLSIILFDCFEELFVYIGDAVKDPVPGWNHRALMGSFALLPGGPQESPEVTDRQFLLMSIKG